MEGSFDPNQPQFEIPRKVWSRVDRTYAHRNTAAATDR